MEAITVRPSLDKFLNVVITKNAEALHHQAHKPHVLNPHEQTNKQTINPKKDEQSSCKLLLLLLHISFFQNTTTVFSIFFSSVKLSYLSRPLVGSSKKSMRGQVRISRAILTLRFSPPQKCFVAQAFFKQKKPKKNVSILPFRGHVGLAPTPAGLAPNPQLQLPLHSRSRSLEL